MMAHANDFVVSIKHGGKALREIPNNTTREREVFLPDGSEYSIHLKNKTDRKAVAHVYIDGTEAVTEGLVLPAGFAFDLQRFVLDGNMESGASFRFVAVHGKEGHKVDNPDTPENGLVRVEFFFEKEKPKPRPKPLPDNFGMKFCRGMDIHENVMGATVAEPAMLFSKGPVPATAAACSEGSAMFGTLLMEEEQKTSGSIGATAAGEKVSQRFTMVNVEEESNAAAVILLRLKIRTEPLRAQDHVHCSACGARAETGHKFCYRCGAPLYHNA